MPDYGVYDRSGNPIGEIRERSDGGWERDNSPKPTSKTEVFYILLVLGSLLALLVWGWVHYLRLEGPWNETPPLRTWKDWASILIFWGSIFFAVVGVIYVIGVLILDAAEAMGKKWGHILGPVFWSTVVGAIVYFFFIR